MPRITFVSPAVMFGVDPADWNKTVSGFARVIPGLFCTSRHVSESPTSFSVSCGPRMIRINSAQVISNVACVKESDFDKRRVYLLRHGVNVQGNPQEIGKFAADFCRLLP